MAYVGLWIVYLSTAISGTKDTFQLRCVVALMGSALPSAWQWVRVHLQASLAAFEVEEPQMKTPLRLGREQRLSSAV